MRVTKATPEYGGSKPCGCGRLLTPLEALYSRDGLCQTCHKKRVTMLITGRMAPIADVENP